MASQNFFVFAILLALTSSAMSMYLVPKILNPSMATRTVLICRNPSSVAALHVLRCSEGESIKVSDAIFGIKDHVACPVVINETKTTANQDCDENVQSLSLVRALCENRQECSLVLRNIAFPLFCPDEAFQALRVSYSCLGSTLPLHPFANSKGTRYGDEIFKGRRGRTRTFRP